MALFEALADRSRRTLYQALCDEERSVGELVEFSGLTQPAVSQHLKVLREQGLVDVRAEGRRRIYSVDPAPLAELDVWLSRYRHLWSDRLDNLERHLKENPL